MKRSQFNYLCPEDLIAQAPTKNRDDSRLLVYHPSSSSEIEDHYFSEIPKILNNRFSLKDKNQKLLLIANNSKVYPARIQVYRKTGAKCEVFVLDIEDKKEYSCLIKPKSKLKDQECLYLNNDGTNPVFQISDLKNSILKPLFSESMVKFLEKHGQTPLPPYIKRTHVQQSSQSSHASYVKNENDKHRYQNIYANDARLGSAAAPTAGFHFSDTILNKLSNYNIEIDYITLHVGLGTFLPVKAENIPDHTMHEETYYIDKNLIKKIFEYLKNGWPIVYVGTTSLRTIESFFRKIFDNKNIQILNSNHELYLQKSLDLSNNWHTTNLFLFPNDEFDQKKPLIGNALITNFHQPESSLLMLVSSIIGYHNLVTIYAHAIKQKYRFFSYGDSSLLIF